MTQYRIFLIFLSFLSVPISAMDGNPTRRFNYWYDGSTSYQDLLPPTQPTRRTRKPTLLFEYFGLPESYARSAAVNVKQIIVEKILGARPIWQQKTNVCHQGVHSVSYNNDGRMIATAGNDNAVYFADQAGRIIATRKYPHAITDAVFHPTDQSLIVCSDQLFDKIDAKGKTLKTIRAGLNPVKCALNAKKNELAAIDANGLLKVWSLSGGIPFEVILNIQGVSDFACHESGDLFAVVANYAVQLYERSTGQLLDLPHDVGVKTVSFQPHGNMLVTGSFNGLLTLWKRRVADAKKPNAALEWNVAKIIPVDVNNQHGPHIDVIEFHPRGNLFASLHFNRNNIWLWDSSGNNIAIIPHTHGMRSLAFHPENHEFAVGHDFNGMPVVLWAQEQFPTLEQILLRLILKKYIIKCIAARRKPGYPVNPSAGKFVAWMCDWFHLDTESITRVWNTFSDKKRVVIARTYVERARKVADMVQSRADDEQRMALYRKLETEQQKNK